MTGAVGVCPVAPYPLKSGYTGLGLLLLLLLLFLLAAAVTKLLLFISKG